MQGLPAGGAMLALSASEAELVPLLEQYTDRIDVAAVNGPQAVVVSGDEDAVLAVGRHFEAQGRRVSRLRVSHAFHSRRMDEMLEPFGRDVRDLQLRSPTVPIISNVTGKLATADELRQPSTGFCTRAGRCGFMKRFSLDRTGTEKFLELGPQAVLSALVQEGLSEGAQGRARLWAHCARNRTNLDPDGTWRLVHAWTAGGVERILLRPLAARYRCRPMRSSQSAIGWRADPEFGGEMAPRHRTRRKHVQIGCSGNPIHVGVAVTSSRRRFIRSPLAWSFLANRFSRLRLCQNFSRRRRRLAERLSSIPDCTSVFSSRVCRTSFNIVSPAKEGRRAVRIVSRRWRDPRRPGRFTLLRPSSNCACRLGTAWIEPSV